MLDVQEMLKALASVQYNTIKLYCTKKFESVILPSPNMLESFCLTYHELAANMRPGIFGTFGIF